MALVITPNIPRDFRGRLTANEGGPVQWMITSTDVNLRESVQVGTSSEAFAPNTPAQIISFAPGLPSTQYATFTALQDSRYEVDEQFFFQFTAIGGTVLTATESGGYIANDDRLPLVSLSARPNTLLENATDPVFRFDIGRAGEDLTMVTTVEIRFRPTGPTPADAVDFTGALADLAPQVVRFGPGETIKTLELRIANDATVEATESLDVIIQSATSTSEARFWSGTQFNPINRNSTVVSILNDDPNAPEPPPGTVTTTNTPPSPIDVYRFYRAETGTHFFTASAQERDVVRNSLPQYAFEGVGFQAVSDQPGADPIYRFFRAETGTHFFTPSAAERDSVIAQLPQYSYEGIAFHGSNQDGAGLTEVHRFFRSDSGTHFYTPSILEKSTIEATLPQYKYEGVGFWVPDSPDYLLI